MTDDPALRARMRRVIEAELTARAGLQSPAGKTAPEPAAQTPNPRRRLVDLVHGVAADALRMPRADLDPTENLANYGVDSIAITEIMVQISRRFEISVAPTTFFEARSLVDLADILAQRYGEAIDATLAESAPLAAVAQPQTQSGVDVETWLRRHKGVRRKTAGAKPAAEAAPPARANIPIAIIGIEGMFPKSENVEALRAHLRNGDDCIETVPADRWDWRAVDGDPRKGPFTDVKFGGFVPDVAMFDAGLFGLSRREAELIDPQHRLFMQCVWSLLESAGHAPSSLSGRKVGLFVGLNLLDYVALANEARLHEAQQLTGLGHAFCPNRLSFLLDIHGPSAVIDTACSSSLVAINRAVMSIRHEGCEMAIAGGSNLMLSPMQHIMFSQVGMICADGRCKTFSAEANGYARADGVGAVLLKPLADAERDRDRILGVIIASAEQHGGGATSLTAPNPQAQARLIVEAHRQAGVDPRSIGLIECHGTGTKLGDPIEIEGLKSAFATLYRDHGLPDPERPHIGLGSIKSNIGHAETAAGVAGLIKILLGFEDERRFGTLHCAQVNPLIDLRGTPFEILSHGDAWTRPVIDGVEHPRRAGLSSFGAGGANVHMVIEDHRGVPAPAPASDDEPFVIPLSARSEEALDALVRKLAPLARQHALRDIAGTLQTGRSVFAHRVAFVARSGDELAEQMRSYLDNARAGLAAGCAPRGAPALTIDEPDLLKPADLAAAWAAGAAVRFGNSALAQAFQRVRLPTYAFEKRHYWLPTSAAPQRTESRLQELAPGTYRTTLRPQDSFLRDHLVKGEPVLPAIMHLELAREAARLSGLSNVALRNVTWLQPLAAPHDIDATIRLVATANGAQRVEISTGAGEAYVLHAQMLASTQALQSSTHDLDDLRARHDDLRDIHAIYDRFAARGIAFGPAHRSLTSLAVAHLEGAVHSVLARISLPSCVAASASAFGLHPSMLDGAFQAAIAMSGDSETATALPFALTQFTGSGPCPTDLWALVTRTADSDRLDMQLLDDDGVTRFSLSGFATRSISETAAPQRVLTFAPEWRSVDAPSPADKTRRLLTILDADVAAQQMNQPAFGILRAGSLTERASALLRLLQQILRDRQPTRVQLILRDAGLNAALHAMVQTAAQEHPALCAQTLLVQDAAVAQADLDTLQGLPAGLYRPGADGMRHLVWRETQLAHTGRPWRRDGVYLITGGAGALGAALARNIKAHAPEARIILAGRRRPAGADTSFIEVDMASSASVTTMIEDIRARHAHLHGVIHCAGVLRDGPILSKTQDDLATVLGAKIDGAVFLDEAIGSQKLDLFVTYASLSGVFGNPGQADYAVANAALDLFAGQRAARVLAGQRHGFTASLAWPLWRDGGMRMDAGAIRLMTQTTGLVPLETDAGLAVLERALGGGQARLAVACGDAARLRARFEAQPPRPPAASAPAAPGPTAALKNRLRDELMACAAQQLKVSIDDLSPQIELSEYGFDSIGFTQFANALNDRFALELTPTLFFECPTLDALTLSLSSAYPAELAAALGLAVANETVAAAAAPILLAQRLAPPEPALAHDPVAIIAMSGRFPGAPDVEAFWNNLADGVDSISEIPPDRWDWRPIWGHPQKESGKTNVKWGGFIEGVAEFDPAFFGLSAPEARGMDPQQRLLLNESWRLFERAGIAPQSLWGRNIGVFLGIADTGYGRMLAASSEATEAHMMTGLAPSLGPNRISYYFNFHGPSVAVETACSSALVALHRAVEAIRAGECESAIAGGVNTLLLPDTFIGFSRAGMLSPDGRSKPFAAQADGYARGEGLGLFLLKPLSAALRDGDDVQAIIRASAENHGGRATSLTAPNPRAQADLLRAVYRKAAIDPRSIGYIEAHGTGTPLGDPIEFEALANAFASLTQEAQERYGPAPEMRCAVGSVKSNIGHLEIAAGAAGVMKVLLQMKHRRIAATLHGAELNPLLKLDSTPFEIATTARDWTPARDASGADLPLRAGVSSFGFGGTNAHVVLEAFAPPEPRTEQAPAAPAVIVLSAKSEAQLRTQARNLADALAARPIELHDLARTLATGREAMEHRLAFIAASTDEVRHRLSAFSSGDSTPAIVTGRVKASRGLVGALIGDPVIADAVASLPERGGHDLMLRLWADGMPVDWSRVLGRGRRVALPGYPFERQRFWPGRAAQTPPEPPPLTVSAEPAKAPETAPAQSRPDAQDVLARLRALAAATLEVSTDVLDVDTELGEFGLDSITMTSFAARVNDAFDLDLTPPVFFEYATLTRLAAHVRSIAPAPAAPDAPMAAPSEPRRAAHATAADEPLAIVGMSCEFPGARDADEFWRVLVEGRDCISRIPPDRWDWRALDGDPRQAPGKTNIHWGGFIEGAFAFDPLFFNISPREARLMDPQQRLMLTHAWKAIEDAGEAPTALAGRRGGVFVATSSSGYRQVIGDKTGTEGHVATGSVPSVGPNRISYFLDWHGPSEPVETACSSSLVALHRAAQAIRDGDCDFALVGGVNTIVTPEAHINFAKANMLSQDGRCKTFSSAANGYVRGEGVGMIFVKRLSEARRDGNPVLAILRSSAINHGGKANSLTAPNTSAQAEALGAAWHRAAFDPHTLTYIEAHGTGTALGDPVEINALKAAWAAASSTMEPGEARCAIGAVKTNIGHLELAAGMASIIKVLLQMREGIIAPNLHGGELNPYIDLVGGPFHFPARAEPWTALIDDEGRDVPRRAGVSSFGFGGVNAHVVLEASEPAADSGRLAGPALIVVSGKDEAALRRQVDNLRAFIARGCGGASLAEVAHTLQLGRTHLRHRLAFAAETFDDVARGCAAYLDGRYDRLFVGVAQARSDDTLAHGTTLELADAWVTGARPDWTRLYVGTPRRVHAPTYAFGREDYRIDPVAPPPPDDGKIRLSPSVDGLGDHRFNGACVVPGAYTLALACRHGGMPLPLQLEGAVWSRPIVLPDDGLDIGIDLQAGEHGVAVKITTGALEAMRTQVSASTTQPPPRADLAALKRACAESVDVAGLYESYARLGLDYGPRYRAVSDLWRSDGQALARLVSPRGAERVADLNPSLLDGAFQGALALFPAGSGDSYLPFALRSLVLAASTPDEVWAHLQLKTITPAQVEIDITLMSATGDIVASLAGFTARRVHQTTQTQTPPTPDSGAHADIAARLISLLANEIGLDVAEIDSTLPLDQYGVDSMLIITLTEALEKTWGPLPRNLFFDHRTIDELAAHLATIKSQGQPQNTIRLARAASADDTISSPALLDDPIAIIGVAGRYPGAPDLAAFWDNVAAGRDSVTEIPSDRWDHTRYYDPKPGAPGKTNSRWGGFIADHDRFDPLFFNIAPSEAEFLDPQERIFLQCAWAALEDAGHTRASLAPMQAPLAGGHVGVFVGVMYEEYQLYGAERSLTGAPLALSGSAASIANRVSYVCNFHGPSLTVDTMCSSSLTAIHLACDSIRAGSCEAAIAGGVNLTLHPNKYIALGQSRFLSSDGRCAAFGAGGDGYVPGEGVGAVVLKPLSKALRDGDAVHAVIRGTALNHGGKTNGYTVPNPAAQTAVIAHALRRAGVAPDEISYVEAHGTGTSLGDPIELAALSRVFSAGDGARIAIGSVKSNIGHCESAAGVAGLSKVLLMMRHRMLAPSLHAEPANPGIAFDETPFVVQKTLAPWRPASGRRIASLSSFGAGGSNAHIVLEDISADAPPVAARRMAFPFSARTPERLSALLRRMSCAIRATTDDKLAHVAFTLQAGRESFEERLVVLAATRDELLAGLEAADSAHVYRGAVRAPVPRRAEAFDTLEDAARAWVAGRGVNWSSVRAEAPYRRVSLPTYPFARDRFWIPGAPKAHAVKTPLLFAPQWSPTAARPGAAPARSLTILCEWPDHQADALSASLGGPVERLQEAGPIAARYAAHAVRLLDILQRQLRDPGPVAIQLVVPLDGERAMLEGLAGMLRSAAHEHPALKAQTIGVAGPLADLAALLRAERGCADADVRYVNGQRLVRHWREIESRPDARPIWRPDATYLITGGGGALGLTLCEDIARHAPGATVYLVNRSALSTDARTRVSALPLQMHARQVDLADPAALTALVDDIVAKHGAMDALIHAAGVTRDKSLMRKTARDVADVLQPKVQGSASLRAAFAGREPSLTILFSSAAGALGNAGQTDYAAANAWLDAAAQSETSSRCVSIDWPYWRSGGMQMPAAAVEAVRRATGAAPLETDPALAALHAIVATHERQALVLDGDHDRLREWFAPPPTPEPIAPPPTTDARDGVERLKAEFSAVLKIAPEDLDINAPIDRYGVDSILAVRIIERLEATYGDLPPTLLLEHPTIASLMKALPQLAAMDADAIAPFAPSPPEPEAAADNGAIAIIGLAGRYPGGETLEDFWASLSAGRDCITAIPEARWAHDAIAPGERGEIGASACGLGGFLSDVDTFDAGFFHYSPRDAALADPQERLFLQIVWHALENANHTRPMLRDRYSSAVGVFVGAMYNQYRALESDAASRPFLTLQSYASIANRVSYVLDAQGPSVAVDTMCSAGLQAVHQACQSLRLGECRLAVAGGVNITIHPDKYIALSGAGLIGTHRGSRSFADGDGYLPAEGVGAVVLKPLAAARADGDRILGVVSASAANHAGHSAGYAIPSAAAQAHLIRGNLDAAHIDPRTISYIEAAANGSPLGDAIEMRALARVFSESGGDRAIGSVKANIGHAEAASGLAQLTKVLLQFEHETLAPMPRIERLNPRIDFNTLPFHLQTKLEHWRRPVIDGTTAPRRASISAFGAGGANVHMIVDEPAPRDASAPIHDDDAMPRLFLFTATTDGQLQTLVERMAAFVADRADVGLEALSFTLLHRREHFDKRADIVAASRDELLSKLARAASGEVFSEDAAPPTEWRGGALPVLPLMPFLKERHWLAPSRAADPDAHPVIAAIARELGVAPAHVDQSMRVEDLGLDSMGRIRILSVLRRECGIDMSHRDFERATSVAMLAAAAPQRTRQLQPSACDDAHSSDVWSAQLSLNQRGVYAQQKLDPQSCVYNVPIAFAVIGADDARLARAWRTVQICYPILTSSVVAQGDELALVAQPSLRDLRRVTTARDASAHARTLSAIPFDLEEEPVCRADLVVVAGAPSVLLMTAHHIAIDGLSAAIIADAFWTAYTHDGEAPSAPRTPDYRDYVAAENRYLASPAAAQDRSWWKEQLRGAGAVRPMLPDGPGESGARSVTRSVGPVVAESWKAASRRHGVTHAAFCASALVAMLHQHAGETDITIGMPSLGRDDAPSLDLVGFCANLVHLRIVLSPGETGATLIARMQRTFMDALDHARLPYAAAVQDSIGREHGGAAHEVTFAYQNFASLAPSTSLPTGVSLLSDIRQPSDTLLSFEVHETDSSLELVLLHDGERASAASARLLLDHFIACATALAASPDSPLDDVLAPDAAETARVLAWSRGEPLADDASTIITRIERQVETRPDAVALTCGETGLTYRELWAEAERLAATLQQAGLGRGDRLAVLLGHEPRGVITLLAALMIGAAWLPLSPDQPDARLSLILTNARPAALLASAHLASRAAGLAGAARVIDLDTLQAPPCDLVKEAMPDAGAAYIIYTSGTTGEPKGVVVSRAALAHHCAAIIAATGLGADDRVLQFASQAVDPFIEQTLPTLACGARIVIRSQATPSAADLRRLLADEAVTVADLPPSYLREVLIAWRASPRPALLPALRLLIVGGETCPVDLPALHRDSALAGARLLNAYGPTEATVTCLLHEVSRDEAAIPIGRPLPETEIKIVDRRQRLVRAGMIGELLIGGDRLATGYLEAPELTDQRFIQLADEAGGAPRRFYRTGDLASFALDGSGAVRFHGRADRQVKIRGYRIEPDDIASALRRSALVRDAAVRAWETSGGAQLIAYCIAAFDNFDESLLHAHAARSLPSYMRPAVYMRVDALPINAAGKIDWPALPSPRFAKTTVSQAPFDDDERALRLIWSELLGLDAEQLGRDDDFFACGGHSLLILRLQTRIVDTWAREIAASAFLAATTIAAQAKLLRSARTASEPHQASNPALLRAGEGAPVLLIHPIGGGLGCYAPLLAHLAPGRPIFGLSAPGLEDGAPWSGDLAGLASAYIEAAVPHVGPHAWRLAGWSMGGVIAQEMARQLDDRGLRVDLLGLIDAYPGAALGMTDADEATEAREFANDLFGTDDGAPPAEAGPTSAQMERLFNVFRANRRLLALHRPARSPVPATLISTAAGAPLAIAAWRTAGEFATSPHVMQANHVSIVGADFAPRVAAILNERLDAQDHADRAGEVGPETCDGVDLAPRSYILGQYDASE